MESVRLTSGWVVISLSYQVLPSREEIQNKVKTNQQTEATTGGKKRCLRLLLKYIYSSLYHGITRDQTDPHRAIKLFSANLASGGECIRIAVVQTVNTIL